MNSQAIDTSADLVLLGIRSEFLKVTRNLPEDKHQGVPDTPLESSKGHPQQAHDEIGRGKCVTSRQLRSSGTEVPLVLLSLQEPEN